MLRMMKKLPLLFYATVFGMGLAIGASGAQAAENCAGSPVAVVSTQAGANFEKLMAQAAQGQPEAQYFVGCNYLFNPNFMNMEDAYFWLHNSADKGYDKAQFLVAYMLDEGLSGDKNSESATAWLKEAAAGGNEMAKRVLAGEKFSSFINTVSSPFAQ